MGRPAHKPPHHFIQQLVGATFYCAAWAAIFFSSSALTALRLKLAPACIGGNSMNVQVHLIIAVEMDLVGAVIELLALLEVGSGPRRQSRSAFKRACATAAWPDALQ